MTIVEDTVSHKLPDPLALIPFLPLFHNVSRAFSIGVFEIQPLELDSTALYMLVW